MTPPPPAPSPPLPAPSLFERLRRFLRGEWGYPDDRGVRQRLLCWTATGESLALSDPKTRRALAPVLRSLEITQLPVRRRALWQNALGLLWVVCVALALWQWIPRLKWSDVQMWVIGGGIGLVFLGVNTVRLMWRLSRRGGRLVGVATHHGICPACGYDLADAKAHADGCVACPECGAAWRESRISREAIAARQLPDAAPGRFRWDHRGDPVSRQGRRATDDRDHPVFLGVPDPDRDGASVTDDERRGCLNRARSSAFRADVRGIWRWPVGVITMFVGAATAIALKTTVADSYRWSDGVSLFVVLGVFGLGVVAGALIILRRSRAKIAARRAALLGEGLCACCTANVLHLDPEADGCVVCPECFAAWRLPGPTGGAA